MNDDDEPIHEAEVVLFLVKPVRRKHEWVPSRLGHGETQCKWCLMTNREAWVLGEFCIR